MNVLQLPQSPSLTLVVQGQPVAKARARTVRNRYSGKIHSFTPDETAAQENKIAHEWQAQGSKDCPGLVSVTAYFFFRRPRTHFNAKGELNAAGKRAVPGRSDLDNYVKLVLDALNKAAFEDDRMVTELLAGKRWSDPEDPPRTFIFIRSLT